MKARFILPILVALVAGSAVGQPTLDVRYFPIPGTAARLHQQVLVTAAEQATPATGGTRTWDFRFLNNPGEVNPVQIYDTTAYPVGAGFRATNSVFSSPTYGTYFLRAESSIMLVGIGSGDTTQGVSERYERPRLLFPDGLQYGHGYHDSLTYTEYANGQHFHHILSYTVVHSGYGEIKVANSTHSNSVVQLHYTERHYDLQGNTTFLTRSLDRYAWFSPYVGIGMPIANWQREEFSGGQPVYRFEHIEDAVLAAHPAIRQGAPSISPNPTPKYLTIKGITAPTRAAVMDKIARQVLTTTIQPSSPILDISKLKSGAYLLTLYTPKGPVMRRFIKE